MKCIPIKLIAIALILISCERKTNTSLPNPIETNLDLINIPCYEIDGIYLKGKVLMVDLINSESYNNPTTYIQALGWYSFQLDQLPQAFDSLQLNVTMPNRDSIQSVYPNKIDRLRLKQLHQQLDNTILGNFYYDLYQMNWESHLDNEKDEFSLIDRINSLFARTIDTSEFKKQFPNNSTWFGIDCFPIFEMYFREMMQHRPFIGHKIVAEIKTSEGYFNTKDKEGLLKLIDNYGREFTKIGKVYEANPL